MVNGEERSARAAPAGAAGARGGAVLAVTCVAQFMVVLDVSVVNVALPSVQAALGFDQPGLHWVVNAYALVFAGFLLLGGRLADLYGRKRTFVAGLAMFCAASLVGGVATAPGVLVGARAAQGLGAAVLAPATLAILTTTFVDGPSRLRALATWTAVSTAGGAAGNLLGGLLTEFLSWRWTLLINVPIAIAAGVAALLALAADRPRERAARIDLPGALSATIGLAALAYGVTQAPAHGWGDPVAIGALAAGLAALVAFVVVEARHAPEPLLPLGLFRLRTVAVGNTLMALTGACFVPMWYFLSLTMQHVLHYGPMRTAVGLLPHTVLTILAARAAPWLMTRCDGRTLIGVGAGLAALGFLWQSRLTVDSGYIAAILGPAVLLGAGGILITPLTHLATAGVRPGDAGVASGLMNTAKQAGGALGLGALVALGASHDASEMSLADGYGRAFLGIAAVLVVVAAAASALPGTCVASSPDPARTQGRSEDSGRA